MDILPGLNFPNLKDAKRILAVQPHYDDNDIAAGGTLHSLAKLGAELIYLTVTNDLAGVIAPDLSEDESRKMLSENQEMAGSIIGVSHQMHLGYPDAGEIHYFELRRDLIHQIWKYQPDFIFTVDPWSPYEAHNDHILTGKAVAEASILYSLPAFCGQEEVEHGDYHLEGIAFYNSAYPNLIFDISEVIETKNKALMSYNAQFTLDGLYALIAQTSFLAGYTAQGESFSYGEALKIVAPWMLHGVPLTKQL